LKCIYLARSPDILTKNAAPTPAQTAIGFAFDFFQMLSFSLYSLAGDLAWNAAVLGWLQAVCSSFRMCMYFSSGFFIR
jgi:hypothetical protein